MGCAGFLRGQLAALQLTRRPPLRCAAWGSGRCHTAASPPSAGKHKHVALRISHSHSLRPSWLSQITGEPTLTAAQPLRWRPAHEQQHRCLHQQASRAPTAVRAAQTGSDAVGSAEKHGGSSGSSWLGTVGTWLWALARGLVAVAALAALTAAALPAVVSTPAGLRAVLSIANVASPARVDAARVQAGWLRDGMVVEGFSASERAADGGETLVEVDRVAVSRGLWDVVRGAPYDVVLSGARIDATLDSEGDFKLERLMAAARPLGNRALPTQSLPPTTAASGQPAAIEDAALLRNRVIALSAEGQLESASVFLADGSLLVPEAYAQILGDRVHAAALIGAENALQGGQDIGADTDWVQSDEAPRTARGTGRALAPTVLALQSPHVDLQLHGWRTTTGMVLREPATASVEYTPALARYGLSLLNPLLGGAVGIRESGEVHVSAAPEQLHLPADKTTFRLEPLRLTVGRGELLDRIIRLIGLDTRALGRVDELSLATGPLVTDVYKGGAVVTHRADLTIGGGSSADGLHLVVWGRGSTRAGSAVDMVIGIPADTLARLGVKVPDGEVLPIYLHGSSTAPVIDWVGTSSRLATLMARNAAETGAQGAVKQGLGWPQSLVGRVVRGVEGRTGALTIPAPPPVVA